VSTGINNFPRSNIFFSQFYRLTLGATLLGLYSSWTRFQPCVENFRLIMQDDDDDDIECVVTILVLVMLHLATGSRLSPVHLSHQADAQVCLGPHRMPGWLTGGSHLPCTALTMCAPPALAPPINKHQTLAAGAGRTVHWRHSDVRAACRSRCSRSAHPPA